MPTLNIGLKNTSAEAYKAAAWGDLSEISKNMLKNLFAVYIQLPKKLTLTGALAGASGVISLLASAVAIPDEKVLLHKVETKLSNHDIVVGKDRGTFSITFMEQIGAPVATILSAWHKLIVDARGNGLGWPDDYRTKVYVAALDGNGAPFYWFNFKGVFPIDRLGTYAFSNAEKAQLDTPVTFSYIAMEDAADTLSTEGANMINKAKSATKAAGFSA